MIEHNHLTSSREVQQSVFQVDDNLTVSVTVNFGSVTYQMTDTISLEPMTYRVDCSDLLTCTGKSSLLILLTSLVGSFDYTEGVCNFSPEPGTCLIDNTCFLVGSYNPHSQCKEQFP